MIPALPADEPLFGAWARTLAEQQQADAAYRWLVLSDDTEAAGLRRALAAGFALAGPSREVLAKALSHERWGQHAGARGHLLALALLAHEGWSLTCEPSLGGQVPDLLGERQGRRALIEVRSMTGCGAEPWADGAATARSVPPARRGNSEKQRRQRARLAAVERAAAEKTNRRDLARSVTRAIVNKAEAYAQLVEQAELLL